MKKMILLLVMAFMLTGCIDGNRYNFTGSNENWEFFYTVDVFGDNRQQNSGTIKYTGTEEPPESISYEIVYTLSKSGGSGYTLEEGIAKFGGGCAGCAVPQKETEIEAEISWNGKTEKLILTTRN